MRDQQKSKVFYLNLGFQLIIEAPIDSGNSWIQLGIPDQPTMISLVPWYPEMPAGTIQGLILESEDIEAEVRSLRNVGIEAAPIESTRWGKFAAIKDPDGNGLLLHQHQWE